mmetsp:Transcript_35950/g.80024  ORF Transcript_35950/g.80024 Transcript_35950/m.80024 type:complete len:83 (+) Transcript_35950:393-641(+)
MSGVWYSYDMDVVHVDFITHFHHPCLTHICALWEHCKLLSLHSLSSPDLHAMLPDTTDNDYESLLWALDHAVLQDATGSLFM